ncbi:hypothetical protein [Burkholderia multivorans]|uniref:hypothetical protein n=1 Tax=Burkholderia multivorans TaxID=87883 RepID=UPI002B24F481|nr:hypothetical protein [Burkholderia multivorans]
MDRNVCDAGLNAFTQKLDSLALFSAIRVRVNIRSHMRAMCETIGRFLVERSKSRDERSAPKAQQ